MASFFGFGVCGSILGHAFRFHIECNSLFNLLSYAISYDEEENGIRLMFEFFKIQMFIGISSNIQDLYNYCQSSYFIRQEHCEPSNYEGRNITEAELYESEV